MKNKISATAIIAFAVLSKISGLPQSPYYMTRASVPTLATNGRPAYILQPAVYNSSALVNTPSTGIAAPILTEKLIPTEQTSVTPARVRSTHVPSLHLPVPNFYTNYPYPVAS